MLQGVMMDAFNTEVGGAGFLRGMVGQSPRFLDVLKLIPRIAHYDAPVLIEGETGTGKELAARGIHAGSRRHTKPFVAINCGAIPESLIENELFGHARGAYTDAGASAPGLLRLAHQGSLFLDEIDALPPRGQVALLRFLQDGYYRPLGARHAESADVRIIVASNRRLKTLVGEHGFRADLLFRLHVLALDMPALRDRPGDPWLLAHHFLDEFTQRYGNTAGIARRSIDARAHAWLDAYAWPGNVRELENLVHRVFLLAEGPELLLPAPEGPVSGHPDPVLLPDGAARQSYTAARAQALDAFHRRYLIDLLRHAQGNVTHAARLAGKERRALGKLLQKYHIDPARFRTQDR
ncbi:sigma-54 dependent transcriptional regulator [Massilia sp. DD77]|uniref:sigma-54 dependent transcriptional regulator n=1 Tax=Massilia sp. DD77 TaxID=3109349 RepID=UPI002FFFC3EE